jgi:O-antigen/teichoic acid export membrane protein
MSVLGRAGTLVIAVIQARILGKAGYGELGMVLSTLTLFGLFSNAAGGQTCTKFIAECRSSAPVRAGRIAAMSVVITISLSVVAVVAVVICAPTLASRALNAPRLTPLLWLAGASLGLMALTSTFSGILMGLQLFRADSMLRLAQIIAWLPLTAWLSWKWDTFGAMLAYTLSQAVGLAVYAIATHRICQREGFALEFPGMWREYRVLLQFSLPMMLHGFLCVPTVWLCNAILARQPSGYAALGGYTAAVQFRTVVLQVPMLIQGVVWPMMAELYGARQSVRLASLFQTTFDVLWAVGLLAALPMVAFGSMLMSLFGRDFAADHIVMALVMATTSVSLISGFSGVVLQVANRTWPALYANIAYGAVSVLGALVLVPRYGALGLATAFVISTLIQAMLVLLLIRASLPDLHCTGNFVLVFLSLLFCLAMLCISHAHLPHTFELRTLSLVVCAAIIWLRGLAGPARRLTRIFASPRF